MNERTGAGAGAPSTSTTAKRATGSGAGAAASRPGARPLPRTGRSGGRLSNPVLWVWVGLGLAAAGFGLIAFTWGKTAALLDVALQVPYLVSGGLGGIGLVLVGLLVVNLGVKRREALERRRQLEELRDAIWELRVSIEGVAEED